MAERPFDPNQLSFAQGLERIERAEKQTGIKLARRILTSRDPEVAKLTRVLSVTNIPDDFQKWQLPVYLNAPSQLFISYADQIVAFHAEPETSYLVIRKLAH